MDVCWSNVWEGEVVSPKWRRGKQTHVSLLPRGNRQRDLQKIITRLFTSIYKFIIDAARRSNVDLVFSRVIFGESKGWENSRRWDAKKKKKKRKIKCHELYSSMFNSRPPGRSERGLLIGSPEREYIRCKGTQSSGCGRERACTPQNESLLSPF